MLPSNASVCTLANSINKTRSKSNPKRNSEKMKWICLSVKKRHDWRCQKMFITNRIKKQTTMRIVWHCRGDQFIKWIFIR
jgi:hypothetical protein